MTGRIEQLRGELEKPGPWHFNRTDMAAALAEIDRLRAELAHARSHDLQRPCRYDQPHPCHLHLNGMIIYHCQGILAPQE